jgi:predicted transcriptional regulator
VGNIFDLMFEISNEDRFSILLRLEEGATNVTGLARELGLTTQETSRHLSRLGDVSLTRKDPEGMFTITSFGGLALRLLNGLKFVSKHEDYFATHHLGNLPEAFVSRMGELMDSTYLDDVMVMVHSTENILREAEDYVLNINMPYIASVFPHIRDAYERGVKGRFIHTEKLKLPPSMMDVREKAFDDEDAIKIRAAGIQEERLIDDVDLILYMNEREVGILAFPELTGRYDFAGFTSTDERTHRYCRELFEHHWQRAEPVRK